NRRRDRGNQKRQYCSSNQAVCLETEEDMSQRPQFDIVRAGYDPVQVEDELSRLQKQVDGLREKVTGYEDRIETLDTQFQAIKQRYSMLIDELSLREKAADDVTRLALKEANSVIETAQNNADGIISDAILTAQKILAEVQQYNTESFAIKQGLKKEMENFISVLDKYELPHLGPIESEKEN
ncbi:MAG: DivIVA domain-containing protein, partial [Erysipelotrichaceae bacterium]|nr:DivIVA domain-containing protein [Erysipelotrichaceae bacterium]